MDWFFRTTLMTLTLACLLMGSSASARNFYVAFGDSLTEGCCEQHEAGFTPLLAEILPAPDNTVKEEGTNGASSSNGKDRITTVLGSYPEATHFLIQFGTNDVLHDVSVGAYRDNMRIIIEAVKDAEKRPLLAKVPILYRKEWGELPCDRTSPTTVQLNERIGEYNEVIDELIAEYHLEIAPGQPLTAPDFYSYFESTDIDATDGKSEEFSDCVHPNHTGYEAMAQIWAAALVDISIAVDPDTLQFKVPAGQSEEQPFTVTNTGDVAVALSYLPLDQDLGAFELLNTQDGLLAPGDSTTHTVRFSAPEHSPLFVVVDGGKTSGGPTTYSKTLTIVPNLLESSSAKFKLENSSAMIELFGVVETRVFDITQWFERGEYWEPWVAALVIVAIIGLGVFGIRRFRQQR